MVLEVTKMVYINNIENGGPNDVGQSHIHLLWKTISEPLANPPNMP